MTTPRKDKTPIGQWVVATLAVLTLVGGAFYWIDSKFNAVTGKIGELNTRTIKVEDAVKTLSAQQPEWIKHLIEQLLAVGQIKSSTGDVAAAVRAADTVAILLGAEARDKKPANDSFFLQTLAALSTLKSANKAPAISQATFRAKVELANYRSAVESASPVDLAKGTKKPPPLGQRRSIYANSLFQGVPVVLDGMDWENDTFINSYIVYRGGPVRLNGVRFINCTFSVAYANPVAAESLLRYAILQDQEFEWGKITPNS